jgi:hypothetical protein
LTLYCRHEIDVAERHKNKPTEACASVRLLRLGSFEIVSQPLRSAALIAAASALALSAVPPALAQEPSPTATPPAPPTAPATQAPTTSTPTAPPTAEAPAAAAPAAPTTPDATATPGAAATPGVAAPQAQAPQAQAPQAQAPAAAGDQQQQAEAQAAAEPPPTLPTTGDGAAVASILTNVCEPLVKGGKWDQLAKANGLKLDRKSQLYIIPLAPKTPYRIGLENPGVNANVCTLRVQYAQGGGSEKEIRDTLNIWRYLHKPQMFLHRNEQGASVNGRQAITVTWDNRDNIAKDGAMYGLVFRQEKKPDGSSIGKNFDQGVVEYTIRSAESVGITPTPSS